jgi:ABC-type glycerol-3-phosphate transport system permease component
MEFPGRGFLVAAVVGLLVVPLQLAFVPITIIHNWVGIDKSFLGIWLAHTGFGLPLAVYLLRNYMVGLPRDIRRWPALQSSNSCGRGTTCWWPPSSCPRTPKAP